MTGDGLKNRFCGCLVGGMIGDVIGAAVEAETRHYILRKYPTLDDILQEKLIPDFSQPWQFGHFTDDTQTMIAMAEWILEKELSIERLLDKFALHFEPWRRYGPSMQKIIEYLPHVSQKNKLATIVFPEGSFGNNSVVRVAPVALAYCKDYPKMLQLAKTSSISTHSHRLAVQGCVLQGAAIMFVLHTNINDSPQRILKPLEATLHHFTSYHQSTVEYQKALDHIALGLQKNLSTWEMVEKLGNDITAHRSFPIALYAFLRNSHCYTEVIKDVVYLGGDTDSIAFMAGALSGAFLGKEAIPKEWQQCVREEVYGVQQIEELATRIFEMHI